MISQTREDLVRKGQPLEYFATAIYEKELGFNGVPKEDLENVVTVWSCTTEAEEKQTLHRVMALAGSVAKQKNILKVKWVHSLEEWVL